MNELFVDWLKMEAAHLRFGRAFVNEVGENTRKKTVKAIVEEQNTCAHRVPSILSPSWI